MYLQLIITGSALLAFVLLGFMLNASIKKHEANRQTGKKKKGRNKYMPEAKKFGR